MRTLDSIFQFAGGSADELPLWLVDAHVAFRESDDWEQSVSDQGAEMIESCGVMNERSTSGARKEGVGWSTGRTPTAW
jgi:hypothetical protein